MVPIQNDILLKHHLPIYELQRKEDEEIKILKEDSFVDSPKV